jgi:hypothetical protein
VPSFIRVRTGSCGPREKCHARPFWDAQLLLPYRIPRHHRREHMRDVDAERAEK